MSRLCTRGVKDLRLCQQKQVSWNVTAHDTVDVLPVPFENGTPAAWMRLQFLSFTPNLKEKGFIFYLV